MPRELPGETIRVAIIDDNRLVRDARAAMLNKLPDIRAAASAVAVATFLTETKPDVLLLDVGLGDQDSLRVATAIMKETPGRRSS